MAERYNVTEIIDRMGDQLEQLFARRGISEPLMVGIYTGGVWVAEQLHRRLGLTQPLGSLDISFYRDDFTRMGLHPEVRPSSLPLEVDDAHLILVDDVLYTGRTIRAALNEIFDYGRPASVTLVVLAERDGRELPIQADVVGVHLDIGRHEHVKLSGPEPLALRVMEAP